MSRSRSLEAKVLSLLLVEVEVLGGRGCIGATHQGLGPGRSSLHLCYLLRLRSQEVEVVSVLLVEV